MRTFLSRAALVAALVLPASATVAQLRQQGGDFGDIALFPRSQAKSPDGPDPRNHKYDFPDHTQYEYGKEVYQVKLACKSCPLGDKPLDESQAKRFLNETALWEGLSDKEQIGVETFLRELYNIRH